MTSQFSVPLVTDLKRWLRDTKTTQLTLSKKTGIDQALLSKYARGKWRPGLQNAKRIEDATGGAVTMGSWLPKRRKRAAA